MSKADLEAVKQLLSRAPRASLGTLAEDGTPYVSLVLVADDGQGAPLLLLSDLAEHTKNLVRDARASLLVESSEPDPLASARATFVGTIARIEDARARERFVARHPSAARYAGFKDFSMYRMSAARAHLVAGFGRIAWIDLP